MGRSKFFHHFHDQVSIFAICRNFACGRCGKRFYREIVLRRHEAKCTRTEPIKDVVPRVPQFDQETGHYIVSIIQLKAKSRFLATRQLSVQEKEAKSEERHRATQPHLLDSPAESWISLGSQCPQYQSKVAAWGFKIFASSPGYRHSKSG